MSSSDPPHLVYNHAPAQDRLRCGRTEAGREAQGEENEALVEVLQDQIAYLREQLETRTEELREHRRLLADLIERMPELETLRKPGGATEPSETGE